MFITLWIFGSVLMISLVAFVGVFTVSMREKRIHQLLVFIVPLAVGTLLGGAFLHLIPEALENINNTIISALLILSGIMTFFILEKIFRWHHHFSSTDARNKENPHPSLTVDDNKHVGSLILASDGLHNFVDGIIIAVTYLAGGVGIGIATTIAIVLHEIPQEIGDFGILLYAGYKRTTALFYNFLSALTAVLGAAFVLVIGSFAETLMHLALPFAAGAFIYIATANLVPELHKNHGGKRSAYEIIGIILGILLMYLLLFLDV